MNRYKIKNLRTGSNFQINRETQPQLNQPEWGSQAGTKLKSLCDEWELANGQSAGDNPQGQELWSYPDSREIISENIDAELTAEEQKKTQFQNAIQRVIDYDDDTATPAQGKQFRKDVQRILKYILKSL